MMGFTVGFLAIAAILAVLVAIAAGPNDVDRASYLKNNNRLLEKVPPFPGSVRLSTSSFPWRVQKEPFGDYIAGYATNVAYRTPATTTARGVYRFYAEAFKEWKRGGWSWSFHWPRRFRTAALPESRCFEQTPASVCINVRRFYRRGHFIHGGVVIISVDHRLFESRPS
jgi:hypothetical protein